jgi:hypothetical protein
MAVGRKFTTGKWGRAVSVEEEQAAPMSEERDGE